MDGGKLSPPPSPSFLHPSPPGGVSTRERRLSTSSIDSSISQASVSSRNRKSKKGGGGSRVSDYDDNNNTNSGNHSNEMDDVTLLSFLQTTRGLLRRLSNSSKRLASTVVRKSRPRPKLVCEGEILEQTNMICRDYVLYKLTTKDLVSRKLPLTAAHWPKSNHVINACLTLEHAHPRVYSNISRKLCMTMTSTKVVRVALTSLLEVLFEGQTTWGKIVSMFSVCSLFTEECAVQGHVDFVPDVVDTVVDFTNSRLLDWLVTQGGWDCFPCPNNEDGICDGFGRTFALSVMCACVLLAIATVVFQRFWTSQVEDE